MSKNYFGFKLEIYFSTILTILSKGTLSNALSGKP